MNACNSPSPSLSTYSHGQDEEDGADVGGEGEDLEGGEEGEQDEDGQDHGVDLPRGEADSLVVASAVVRVAEVELRGVVVDWVRLLLETVGGPLRGVWMRVFQATTFTNTSHTITLTSSPSHSHHHTHIITLTSSPSHHHTHIITLTSSPSHHHTHTITLTKRFPAMKIMYPAQTPRLHPRTEMSTAHFPTCPSAWRPSSV